MAKKKKPSSKIPIVNKLPSFVTKEIDRVITDVEHAAEGDLDKVSLSTQVMIANILKDVAMGRKEFSISIPLPKVPNASVDIMFKDMKDVSKGKPQGLMLKYEVYRW